MVRGGKKTGGGPVCFCGRKETEQETQLASGEGVVSKVGGGWVREGINVTSSEKEGKDKERVFHKKRERKRYLAEGEESC